MAVFVNNATSFTIRITASFFKVAPSTILAFNCFFSFEAGWLAMIFVGSILFIRRKRSQYSSPRIDLDTTQMDSEPRPFLERFRIVTASTLLIQIGLVTTVVLMELSIRWDPSSSYNGFNLLIVFYLIPLFIPLLMANELFKRRQCKKLLAAWSLGAAMIGHYFLWAWYIGGGASLFGWALSYIVPTWIIIAFVLAEAISLRRYHIAPSEELL